MSLSMLKYFSLYVLLVRFVTKYERQEAPKLREVNGLKHLRQINNWLFIIIATVILHRY